MIARLVSLLVAVFCLAPFAGLLATDDRTLPDGPSRDYLAAQLPIREYARAEMLAGRFPLWIPFLAGGLPLHAGQQASLAHPIVTPLVLAFGAGYGLKLCLLLCLASAYTGAVSLARHLGVGPWPSYVAGVANAWSGFAINHLMAGHVTLLLQYALVPWFFLALSSALRSPCALAAAGLSVVAACMALSGHPQVLYYALLFGALWVAGSFAAGWGRLMRGRCVGWIAVAALLGVLLSAVQLLPSLELARDGMRESFRHRAGFAVQHALSGLDAIRLLAPNLAGNPFAGPRGFGLGENFHERVVYLGLATMAFALYGLTRRGISGWQWGAAWLVLLALAISLGQSTPAFDGLRAIVPGLGLFRCPGRAFGVASVLAALLAGRGVEALALARPRARGAEWLPLAAWVWCAVTLVGLALADNHDRASCAVLAEFARRKLRADSIAWIAVVTYTAGVFAFARRPTASRRALIYVLAITAVFIDLGWNNVRNFHLVIPTGVSLPSALLADGLPRRFVQMPVERRLSMRQLRYSRLVPAALAARRPLLGTNDGGVLPAATERLLRAVEANPSAALALAGCDYSCSADDGACQPLPPPMATIRYFAEADAAILDVPVEKFGDVQIEAMRTRMPAAVRAVQDSVDRLIVDVDPPCDGRLVVADTWFPGWRATVDGKDVAIGRAHGVFRCVEVARGRHRVIFKYDPLSFRLGFAGSACGASIWCALIAIGLRQRVGRLERVNTASR